ncbi:endospore germination permease [Paenibacillus sp.]|uniref:GerAB/ArcD/ProY family transporter n=1 Tax=Paenibacillus sp. TaxID=58172 RepID=UPI002D4A1901|nr:endospore germination permease [Paenibacillus sp.]HZG58816.1 endospore germination permease [Paenibacillus sp.]
MKTVHISKVQALTLGISSITVTGHLLFIPVVLNHAGRDCWIALAAAAAPALFVGYMVASFSKLYPNQSLVEYVRSIAGRWVGTALACVFLFYFFHDAALSIRGFGEFFTAAITPRTPILVYFAAIVVLAGYAVRGGLEVLARTNVLFLSIMIPIGLLASMLTHKEKDYANFLPILERGAEPVLMGALNLIALYSSFLVLGMVFPNVAEPAKLRKWSVVTMGILLVMFIGPVTGPVAVFGGERSMGLSFPTYQMLRDIQISGLQRLDILAIFLWSLGSFSKISLYLYAVTVGVAKLLRLDDYRFLVAPTGALLVIFSLMLGDSFMDIYSFLQNVYPFYAALVGLVLPAGLLLFAQLRRWTKKERRAAG